MNHTSKLCKKEKYPIHVRTHWCVLIVVQSSSDFNDTFFQKRDFLETVEQRDKEAVNSPFLVIFRT